MVPFNYYGGFVKKIETRPNVYAIIRDFIFIFSETMSVQAFHYVQQLSENYNDHLDNDRKNAKNGMSLWARRLHLALLAYRELFYTLCTMDKSPDSSIRDSSKVIKNNVFYVLEYREFILHLLVSYNELKMSDTYLKDLIETQHVFLKLLEGFCGTGGTIVVQKKVRRRTKLKKKGKWMMRIEHG